MAAISESRSPTNPRRMSSSEVRVFLERGQTDMLLERGRAIQDKIYPLVFSVGNEVLPSEPIEIHDDSLSTARLRTFFPER